MANYGKIIAASKGIVDILNDFLSPYECEAFLGTDFCYYTETNSIFFSFIVPDKDSNAFLKFAEDLFPNVHADIFLWSFLHEVGHHETEDDFEDEDWQEYMHLVSDGLSCEEYFNLPIERAATQWAGDFIQSHVEEVSELWNKLSVAIKTFYNAINLEI